jgi:simple sugar transport system permease protein
MGNAEKTLSRQTSFVRLFGNSPIISPLVTLLVIFIIFFLFVPNFNTWRTFSGIVNAVSISGIVALGVTMLMIAGEFDLSVGALIAMSGFIFGTISTGEDTLIVNTLSKLGLPVQGGNVPLAIVFALLIPALQGLINGLLRVITNIPSFIVTLGTLQIYRGLAWIASGGILFQTRADLGIYDIMNGRLDVINNRLDGANFRTAILWLILLVILMELLLVKTKFGNHVFATGGKADAAHSQGINVNLTKIWCFILSSLMAGVAGIISFSQFKTVRVAEQADIELTVIAAAVVGGTLLTGGFGSIWSGFIGIVLISILRTGVVLIEPMLSDALVNFPPFLQTFLTGFFKSDNFPAIVGLTIIASVILNTYLRKRSSG